MTGGACLCGGFSIRGYVADVRQRDIEKCWPFHPQLFETRVKECATTVLPSLEVLTFNYWRCLAYNENGNICQKISEQKKDISEENLSTDGEIKHVKTLYEIQNGEPFVDIMQIPVLNAESPCLPRGEERNEEGVAQVLPGDLKSEKILLENKLNIYCQTDEIVNSYRLKQLASDRAVIEAGAHQSHIKKGTLSFSGIFSSTVTSYSERDPMFVNKEIDDPLSGFPRLNSLEKVHILKPTLARCLVERTVAGNHNELLPQNDVQQVTGETLLTSQCTLTTIRNAQESSATQTSAQMGTHGLLLKIKGSEFKKQREKRKQILKEKRKHTRPLMGDVFNFPSEAIDCRNEYMTVNSCTKQGKSLSGENFGFTQKNLVLKSALESVTSPIKEIANDKENDNTAVQYKLEKRENDIEQKIMTTHNLRKLKAKKKCHCETHSGCVHDETVSHKSTSELFTFPCEQIATSKTNDNNMAHCTIEEREKDVEHKKILNKDKQRSRNSVMPNLRKLKVKQKRYYDAHFGSVQNGLVHDKPTPESFTSPFEQTTSYKTNDNNHIMYKLERQEKDLKQNKKFNKLILSNTEMQGFRKLKVKRDCHCEAHFGFVKNELVPDKSIPDSFITSFAHTVDEKATASSKVNLMMVEKENDIEQKKIQGNQRLSTAAKKGSRKLKAKRKHLYEADLGSEKKDHVPDKSIPVSFNSPFKHIMNDKTNDTSAVQDMLDKSENDIEQEEVFSKQRMSSFTANNLRKLKMKRNRHCEGHFGFVSLQKSTLDSFTFPFEEVVNKKTEGIVDEKTESSAVHSKIGEKQNNIKEKTILEEKILSSMEMHNSRKLKAKRKYCSEMHFGHEQTDLAQKSFPESFTPPFEQVLNEKINDSSAVLNTQEKRQNGIEQEEIFNKKRLSKAATHNLRKFKVKTKCLREVDSDFVINEFDSDKLTPESLTSSFEDIVNGKTNISGKDPSASLFEEIVNDKTNISSTDPSAQKKRENEIKQKKILKKPRLGNAVIQELGVHDCDTHDSTAHDVAVSEPVDMKSEYRGQQPFISSMSSISTDTKRKWKKKLPQNELFSPNTTKPMEARHIKGKWWEQFRTARRSVPVSDGFAVHTLGSSVAKQRPVLQPQVPSFGQGTMLGAAKFLSKDVCDRGKFVRGVTKRQETQIHRASQECGATTDGNRMSPGELKDMECWGVEQILEKMASNKGNCNSSKYRKRAAKFPWGSNGQSRVTKGQETQTYYGSHNCGAITEGNRTTPGKFKEMEGCGAEQILDKIASKQVNCNSSKHRKRATEIPCGSNGQSKKKKTPTTSNMGRQYQETKQPGRPNIVILALAAVHTTT